MSETSTTITAVIVHPQNDTMLVLPAGLPRVVLTEKVWFPDVETPLRAFRDQLGIEGHVLTCLDEQPGDITYLMVGTGTGTGIGTGPGRWVAEHDHPMARAAREHLALPTDHPVTPAWTKPGWYADALPWLDEHLEAAGTPRTGIPEQVRSWGLSNVA